VLSVTCKWPHWRPFRLVDEWRPANERRPLQVASRPRQRRQLLLLLLLLQRIVVDDAVLRLQRPQQRGLRVPRERLLWCAADKAVRQWGPRR